MTDYGNGATGDFMPGDEPLILSSRKIDLSLKFREVRSMLSQIDVNIQQSDGEYRVCKRSQGEDSAYYTDDLQDALDTGRKL